MTQTLFYDRLHGFRGLRLGGGGGGQQSQPTSTTTVQKADPWSGQQDYLTDVFQKAQDAYGATSKTPYTGSLYAGPNQNQIAANSMQLANAQGLASAGSTISGLGQGLINKTANVPQVSVQGSDPASFQAMLDAALNPVMEKWTQNILPGIQSEAINQGAFGGARANLALGRAAGDAAGEMGNIAAALGYQDRQRVQELMLSADIQNQQATQRGDVLRMQELASIPGLLSTGAAMQGAPASALASMGGQQQMWEQEALMDAYNKFMMEQQAPWIGLPQYADLIQGNYGGSQSGTATMSGMTGPSTTSNILSGALGGGLLGGLGAYGLGVGGTATGGALMGALGPYALGGAVLGGLMGVL